MSNLRNITFLEGDTTHLKYSGDWFLAGIFNDSNGSPPETGPLASTEDLNAKVTFTFPQPVVAFYYFGSQRCCGGMYTICIDCDPNNPHFISIDGVNRSNNGHSHPVVLFSKAFDTPGMHEIVIANQNDTRFGHSQITLASIVLEVPVDVSVSTTGNVPSTVISTITPLTSSSTASTSLSLNISIPLSSTSLSSGSSSSPSSSLPSSSSSSHMPFDAIIGGVLAAVVASLIMIILGCWMRLRRRRRRRPARTEAAPEDGISTRSISTVVHPFNLRSQSSWTMTRPSTSSSKARASMTPSPTRPRFSTKHRRQPPGPGAGLSVPTVSETTRISAASPPSSFPPARNGTTNANSTRRREPDGGPVLNSLLEEDEETLPPDYMDVFSTTSIPHVIRRAGSCSGPRISEPDLIPFPGRDGGKFGDQVNHSAMRRKN